MCCNVTGAGVCVWCVFDVCTGYVVCYADVLVTLLLLIASSLFFVVIVVGFIVVILVKVNDSRVHMFTICCLGRVFAMYGVVTIAVGIMPPNIVCFLRVAML